MAKILVVEDEPLAGLQLQESLAAMGHEVPPVVDSGDAVMAAMITHKPDLVLMDVQLRSYIDGIDAARRLRLLSATPIIFLTAYPGPASEERARAVSPEAYLVKPVEDWLLQESIEQALKKAG